ncbi:MAG: hypothetical protein ABH828_00785 [archaeon]
MTNWPYKTATPKEVFKRKEPFDWKDKSFSYEMELLSKFLKGIWRNPDDIKSLYDKYGKGVNSMRDFSRNLKEALAYVPPDPKTRPPINSITDLTFEEIYYPKILGKAAVLAENPKEKKSIAGVSSELSEIIYHVNGTISMPAEKLQSFYKLMYVFSRVLIPDQAYFDRSPKHLLF